MRALYIIAVMAMLGSSGPLQGQGWELVRTITNSDLDLPEFMEGDRIALSGDMLAYTAAGSIFVHTRHNGGLEQWDMTEVIGPDALPGGLQRHYGDVLAFMGGKLHVESSDGTWTFMTGPLGLIREYRLDSLSAMAMTVDGDRLCISSHFALLGSLVKCWDVPGLGELADPFWYMGFPHPTQPSSSCMGDRIALQEDRMVIANRCSGNPSSGAPGHIRVIASLSDNEAPILSTSGEYAIGYGRSVAWKGDTLFVASTGTYAPFNGLYTLVLQGDTQLVDLDRIYPPFATEYQPDFVLGISLLTDGPWLYSGTDQGLAIYQEQGDSLAFVEHKDLGGPVTCMVMDGDHMAVGVAHPDGHHINVYRRITTGVPFHSGTALARLHVRPNPANDRAWVAAIGQGVFRVEVMDLAGWSLKSTVWEGQSDLVLEREHLPSGSYLIRVTDARGQLVGAGPLVWGADH